MWSGDPATGYGTTREPTEFSPLSAAEQAAFISVIEAWGHVASVGPTLVSDTASVVGDIRVGYTYRMQFPDAVAYATGPTDLPIGGDIWLNAGDRSGTFSSVAPGSYGYYALLHELGHALGLKHSFEGSVTLPTESDERPMTVMSYTNDAGYDDGSMSYYPTTPMWYDIAALQFLYGPNASYRGGDDVYRYEAGSNYLETLWDTGGTDTIEYVSASRGGTIDLRPGQWSRLGREREIFTSGGTRTNPDTVMIYDGVIIENAIGGAGADRLLGNDAANRLAGGPGDDSIDGGAGVDVAVYGSARGSVTRSGSTAVVFGAEGTDTLTAIERLEFTDGRIALDLGAGESAGSTVRLIGAAFGAPAIAAHPEFVGAGITLFDAGVTLLEAATLVVGTPAFRLLAGDAGDVAFVNTVYGNVMGGPAPDAHREYFLNLLPGRGGPMTQAELLAQAASSVETALAIDLAGLQASGVAFV